MNATYVRVFIYFVAPLIGMLPGVTYDHAAHLIMIDLDAAVIGLTAAGATVGGVFKIWGKK